MANISNLPLDRFGLEELLPLVEKRRDERLARLQLGQPADYSDDYGANSFRVKLAQREALARQDMQLQNEKDMNAARSVMQMAGDHMRTKTGLSGPNALAMAQAEMARAGQGTFGSADRVVGGYGGRGGRGGRGRPEEQSYLSPEQVARVDLIKEQSEGLRRGREQREFDATFVEEREQALIDQEIASRGDIPPTPFERQVEGELEGDFREAPPVDTKAIKKQQELTEKANVKLNNKRISEVLRDKSIALNPDEKKKFSNRYMEAVNSGIYSQDELDRIWNIYLQKKVE